MCTEEIEGVTLEAHGAGPLMYAWPSSPKFM